MKTLLVLMGFCVLAVPGAGRALAVLVLLPWSGWCIAFPVCGHGDRALFAFTSALLFLPARLLGWRARIRRHGRCDCPLRPFYIFTFTYLPAHASPRCKRSR